MDYASSSIIGKRDNQEDYGLIIGAISTGAILAVISDGMGGQVAGEQASSNAVNGFVESFSSNNSNNMPLKLTVAVEKANSTLARCIANNPKLKGMGATLVAAHISKRELSWISVGDSILYLYRDKKLHRLNDDHSMMPVLIDSVRRGKITHEEALGHPQRNALRSAITGEEIAIINLREEPYKLNKNDIIVLATDGILTLNEFEISKILNTSYRLSSKLIVDRLLSAVFDKNKPRQDNTLLQVIKLSGDSVITSSINFIAIGVVSLILIVTLSLVAWDNKDLVLRAIGLELIKEKIPTSEAQTSAIKVTPISLEKEISTSDKNQTTQASSTEQSDSITPKTTESVAKNSKTKLSEKKQASSAKTGTITLSNDSPTNIIVKHSSSQVINDNPNDIIAAGEDGKIMKPTAKVEVSENDGEKAKQLLESDHNLIKNKKDKE